MKNKTVYMFAILGIVAHMNLQGADTAEAPEIAPQDVPPEVFADLYEFNREAREEFEKNLERKEQKKISAFAAKIAKSPSLDVIAATIARQANIVTEEHLIDAYIAKHADEQSIVNELEADIPPTASPTDIQNRAFMKALVYKRLTYRHKQNVARVMANIKALQEGLTFKTSSHRGGTNTHIPPDEVLAYFESLRREGEGSTIVAKGLEFAQQTAFKNLYWNIHVACNGATADPHNLPSDFQYVGVTTAPQNTLRDFEDWKYLSDKLSSTISREIRPNMWAEAVKSIWLTQKAIVEWDHAVKNNNVAQQGALSKVLRYDTFHLTHGITFPTSNQAWEATTYGLNKANPAEYMHLSNMEYVPTSLFQALPYFVNIIIANSSPASIATIFKKSLPLTWLRSLAFTGSLDFLPEALSAPQILTNFPHLGKIDIQYARFYRNFSLKKQIDDINELLSRRTQAVHGAYASFAHSAGLFGYLPIVSSALAGAALTLRMWEPLSDSWQQWATLGIPPLYLTGGLILTAWGIFRLGYLSDKLARTQFNARQAVSNLPSYLKPSLVTTGLGVLGALTGARWMQQPSLQNTGWILPGTGLFAGALAGSMITAATEKE